MPTYKNNTTERITTEANALEPGQQYSSTVYLDHAALGLTKISDLPMHNPVILAGEYTGNQTISIPLSAKRFNIHFYQEAGESVIYFNSVANTPPLKLYSGATWNIRVFNREINDIRITLSGGSPALWIIIEPV
jgi:hypothetical protein